MAENDIRKEMTFIASMWIRQNFPEQWQRVVFSNEVEISIDDIISEICLYGCYTAYQKTAEKNSLREHLKRAEMLEDADRVRIQRTVTKINNNKLERYKLIKKIYGESAKNLLPKDMKDIESKLEGYEFNDYEFWEIMDVGDSKFQEWIYQDRLGKKNLKNETFKYEAKEHDGKISMLLSKTKDGSELDKLFAYFALYILEIEDAIEFTYKISKELETQKRKSVPELCIRSLHFRVSTPEFFIPSLGQSEEECSMLPAYSRLIIIREKFINSLIETSSPDAFEKVVNQYLGTVGMILSILRHMPFHGMPLLSWFVYKTNISDWLSLYENSGLVNLFDTNKEWSNKRIKEFRNLHPTVTSKNPKKRS